MKLLLIGCGCVGKCFLELLSLEKIKVEVLIIIEPKNIPNWIYKLYPNLIYIKKAITNRNMYNTLKPILKFYKPFVVDVSVNTDSLKIIYYCSKIFKCNYINTSIENYEIKNPEVLDSTQKGLYKRSLMSQAIKLKKLYGKSKTTALVLAGENPGMCSYMALKGLCDYTKKYGNDHQLRLLNTKNYNLLAQSLALNTIHISEIDTQTPKKERPENHFWNTWSVVGMYSEARDPVQISDKIFPIRGVDVIVPSICIGYKGNQIEFEGRAIPHAEAYTLSNFLSTKEYMPDVFYVYKPSDMCNDSLDMFCRNGYKNIPEELCYVLEQKDIRSGWDSVGCYLQFNNGKKWWCGSVLSLNDVKKLGFKHSGSTPVQVAINLLSSIKYILKHKQIGLITPENIDYEMHLKMSKKYLGKVYSVEL